MDLYSRNKADTHNPAATARLNALARQLRASQTDAEALLWCLLRNRQLGGCKFRRQHRLAGYILDFYCAELRLAIELDGGQHLENIQHDQQRTDQLALLKVTVLRYWNTQILQETEAVLEDIWNRVCLLLHR